MAENSDFNVMITFSIKTKEEERERFRLLRDQAGLQTDNQFLVALLDNFEEPVRSKKEARELRGTIDELRGQVAALQEQLAASEQGRREAEEQATLRANQAAEAANRQQLEYEARVAELTPGENQRRVSFTADNLRVLEYVAARESKRRRQQWSISHVLNWIIYARFVKGMLNADLDSVSDAELRRLGVRTSTRASEAIEI